MKKSIVTAALVILGLSIVLLLVCDFDGVNVSGLVLGFVLLLYAYLHKEKPTPSPLPKLEIADRKPPAGSKCSEV